jgi:antitoxin MazE
MRASIKRWGNSAALRLPSSVLRAANFAEEQEVEFQVQRGRIVIVPSAQNEFDLERLLEGITKENLHGEVDFGKPVGNEAL